MAKGSYVNCAIHALGLFSLVLLIQKGEATTFTVGGSKGWSVPSDNSPVYNQWAERMRFQIGDSLLFVYPTSDSVLRVTQEDYTSCTTTSPLEKYTDGHTEFKFKQSGPHFFISGNKDNCLKNEKLHVVVLADRTKKTTNSPPPSPQPTGAAAATPPAASPSDVSEFTPAPSDEADHPRNGAASFAMTFVGSLGAFVGSSLLLAF